MWPRLTTSLQGVQVLQEYALVGEGKILHPKRNLQAPITAISHTNSMFTQETMTPPETSLSTGMVNMQNSPTSSCNKIKAIFCF
jgi:hypothetical protein